MILDAQLVLSDAQAVTAAAASGNQIDLGGTRDIGNGETLYVVVSVLVAFTDGSSDSTLAVYLQTDDNSSFSSAVDAQLIGTFPALAAIGTTIIAKLDPLKVDERYIRLYYTPANGNLTTGTLDAFIVKDVAAYKNYADALLIS